jgi:hypothetical protein
MGLSIDQAAQIIGNNFERISGGDGTISEDILRSIANDGRHDGVDFGDEIEEAAERLLERDGAIDELDVLSDGHRDDRITVNGVDQFTDIHA